jgi:hypothetical protein
MPAASSPRWSWNRCCQATPQPVCGNHPLIGIAAQRPAATRSRRLRLVTPVPTAPPHRRLPADDQRHGRIAVSGNTRLRVSRRLPVISSRGPLGRNLLHFITSGRQSVNAVAWIMLFLVSRAGSGGERTGCSNGRVRFSASPALGGSPSPPEYRRDAWWATRWRDVDQDRIAAIGLADRSEHRRLPCARMAIYDPVAPRGYRTARHAALVLACRRTSGRSNSVGAPSKNACNGPPGATTWSLGLPATPAPIDSDDGPVLLGDGDVTHWRMQRDLRQRPDPRLPRRMPAPSGCACQGHGPRGNVPR